MAFHHFKMIKKHLLRVYLRTGAILSVFLSIFLFFGSFLISSELLAETNKEAVAQTQKIPNLLLSPWIIKGIDADNIALSRKHLTESLDSLSADLFSTSETLFSYLNKQNVSLPIVSRAPAQSLLTGEAKDIQTNPANPIILEPVWSSLKDQYVVFLLAVHTEKNIILGSSHTIISKNDWNMSLKDKSLSDLLSNRLKTLLSETTSSVKENVASGSKSALHIGFALGRETTRQQDGSSYCINLLVAEKLAKTHLTVNPVGGETLGFIRYAFKTEPKLTRPTRELVTRWNHDSPQILSLNLTWAESVLGGNIPPPLNLEASITSNNNQLDVSIDSKLTDLLNKESTMLSLSTAPKIIKTYGAWAYLDKGRAYGLKMDDRLIASQEIKGHVVGYFGPDLGLKTPEGEEVHEGAIVFIRKGQDKIKPGIAFTFDPQKFP